MSRKSNENKGRDRYKGCCRDFHTASQTPRMADEAIDGIGHFDNGRFSDGISSSTKGGRDGGDQGGGCWTSVW